MEMNGVSFDFEDVFNTSSSPSQFESVLEDIKPDVLQVDGDSILDIYRVVIYRIVLETGASRGY